MIERFRNAPDAVMAVMRNFGWMMASRGVIAIFSLVYLATITRSLGISGFGKFALITGAAQLLATLLSFQTWQIIVQYGVNHVEDKDDDRLARLYRAAVALDAFSAIVGIATSATILHFFADALGMTPALAHATLIFNIIMLLSLRSTPIGIMRLRDRYSFAAAAESTLPTMRLVGTLIAWLLHPTLQGYLIAWAVAELLTTVAHWAGVYKLGDLNLMVKRGRGLHGLRDDNPGIVQFSWTSNFSQTLNLSVKQVPLLMVGGMTGTEAAGGFRLALQLSRSLTIVSQLITRAAFPEMVRAVRNQGVASLGKVIRASLAMAGAVGAIIFFLTVFLGEFVLVAVGGAEFATAYHTLLWLTAAACIDLVIVSFEPSIMASRGAHMLFMARLAAIGVMVVVAVLLEPLMRADGVAAAVLVNAAVQAVLLGLILARLVRRGGAGSEGAAGD